MIVFLFFFLDVAMPNIQSSDKCLKENFVDVHKEIYFISFIL